MKVFLIVFCVLLLTGCTHTVIGNQAYSPDGKYVFTVEPHGGTGKAYVAQSDKKVYLLIKEKGKNNILFKKKMVLNAGDLKIDIAWVSEGKLTVPFFTQESAVI